MCHSKQLAPKQTSKDSPAEDRLGDIYSVTTQPEVDSYQLRWGN